EDGAGLGRLAVPPAGRAWPRHRVGDRHAAHPGDADPRDGRRRRGRSLRAGPVPSRRVRVRQRGVGSTQGAHGPHRRDRAGADHRSGRVPEPRGSRDRVPVRMGAPASPGQGGGARGDPRPPPPPPHDLPSPLPALKGIGPALATRWEQITPEDRELMLRGIQFDTDRLNAILRQLVDPARAAAGAPDRSPQRTAVAQVVEEIATSLARDPDHVRVVWAGSDELNVFVDPERLQLVLEAFVESLVWWASDGPVRAEGRVRDGRLSVEAGRAETELTQEQAERLFRPRAP